MNKKLTWLTLPIVLLFLIMMAPARIVVSLIGDSLPVSISGVSGSIWNGKAASVNHRQVAVSNVSWDLNAFSLILGKASAYVTVKDAKIQFSGDVSMNLSQEITIKNAQMDLSANTLSPFLPLRNASIDGQVKADIQSIVFHPETGPSAVDLSVSIKDVEASITGPKLALGDFRFKAISQNENTVAINAMPASNELDLKGRAMINWPKSVDLNLTVKDDVADNLKSTVAFLKLTPEGRRELAMSFPINR